MKYFLAFACRLSFLVPSPHQHQETELDRLKKRVKEFQETFEQERALRAEDKRSHRNVRRLEQYHLKEVESLERLVSPGTRDAWRRGALERKLKSLQLDMDVQNADLETVLRYLSDHTGVPIRLDRTLGLADKMISMKVTELPMRGLLKLMLGSSNLTAVPLPDGSLFVTTLQKAGELLKEGTSGSAATQAALLDYLFSFRPRSDEAEKKDAETLTGLLDDLDRAEIEAREKAAGRVLRLGRSGRVLLQSLSVDEKSSEVKARLKEALKTLDEWHQAVETDGLDHSVPYLAQLEDPRAYERLKRIVGELPPFDKAGFPRPGEGLSDYLGGWWAYYGKSLQWNAEKDAFEKK